LLVSIDPTILKHYPNLNDAQREIIGHLDGPLLVIAGPGSGKTFSIVLRTLNLLIHEKAIPREIALCTFTEKAAFEMRDRLASVAREVGYNKDLSEITVSTIHGLCNSILMQYRHHTRLGHNYETLDDLTQQLFIFEHFYQIIKAPKDGLYLNRWKTRWTAVEGAQRYFNRITEELIDPKELIDSGNPFISSIGQAYQRYEDTLIEANRTDFAHLQRFVLDLLNDPAIAGTVRQGLRYVLVDEYQDTNYIQEQVLLKLTEQGRNLCVVGDEDQSLYRFRGATVRNILEFPQHVPNCKIIKLTINYRSHRDIVERYDRWMASINWTNPNGPDFRYNKKIEANHAAQHPTYPAVFAIWGSDRNDEATRLADFVEFLKKNDVIKDYSQVAILLHSVREEHSGHYIKMLKAKDIPVFCPRARAWFYIPEVRLMAACFAVILGWYNDNRGQMSRTVQKLAQYIDEAIKDLASNYGQPNPLAKALTDWNKEIADIEEGKASDLRLSDYFYKLLAHEPFRSAVRDENIAYNLAIFSQLLNIFQRYYHYTVISFRNREGIRSNFFNSFLRLLFDGGINEYEDQDRPFPKGYIQIMTIHQAKGLEFPVVIVDSLGTRLPSPKGIDRDLGPYYRRPPFEPENKITQFDRMRLHYVAFSRPQKVLVLTAHDQPKDYFAPIWQGLPQWPYVEKDLLAKQRFELREHMPVKKTYSFTGDLQIYETCPRQYQFFREYDFTPSRSAVIFFGLLVHQTIEEIHRTALEGRLDTLDESRIRSIFDNTFRFLSMSDVRRISDVAKEAAFNQVINYFRQNREDMKRIVQTEVDVSLEKDGYILVGKVDLLMGGDGKLELLDFKTSPRPKNNPKLHAAYERQLCTYAHILEQRHGCRVDRLFLYWTSEQRKEDALMVLPYNVTKVEEAGRHFDDIVQQIQARDFKIKTPPEPSICKECDLRMLCRSEGIITTVE